MEEMLPWELCGMQIVKLKRENEASSNCIFFSVIPFKIYKEFCFLR